MSSLFDGTHPFASPETCLALCRRIQATLLDIGPELTQQDCARILGEEVLCERCLHQIAERIKNSADYEARTRLSVSLATEPRGEPPLRHPGTNRVGIYPIYGRLYGA